MLISPSYFVLKPNITREACFCSLAKYRLSHRLPYTLVFIILFLKMIWQIRGKVQQRWPVELFFLQILNHLFVKGEGGGGNTYPRNMYE